MTTESSSVAADSSKRRFLLAGLATAGAAPTLLTKAQESIATMEGKKAYKKEILLLLRDLLARNVSSNIVHHATFVSANAQVTCTEPAFMEYGLGGVMQPTVSFEKGFCNFDCTVCSDVCPNGAIPPLTVEQKHLTPDGLCRLYRRKLHCPH